MYLMIAPPKTFPWTFPSVGIISRTVVICETETCLPSPLRFMLCWWAGRAMVDKADSSAGRVEDRPLDYVTPDQMSELERGASEYGMGVKELMENAGREVAEFV